MPPESELCAAGSCGHRVSVRVHLSPSCPSPTKDTAGHARYGHNVEQYRKEAVRHRPYNRGRGARRDSVQGARGDRKEGSGPALGSLHVGQQGPRAAGVSKAWNPRSKSKEPVRVPRMTLTRMEGGAVRTAASTGQTPTPIPTANPASTRGEPKWKRAQTSSWRSFSQTGSIRPWQNSQTA